jgi:hypothetical protein
MSRSNGGIIGKANDPTDLVANGIWSLAAAEKAKRGGNWPDIFSGTALRLDFDQTTTLDSRITFTRATDGTFFNSTGVLSTASSGAARFDHRLEVGVWVNKGLLIEEQRTNSAGNSESLTQTFTGSNNSSLDIISATTTNNDINAPDGTTTGGTITKTGTAGRATTYLNNPGSTKNTRYSFSGFFKAGSLQSVQLRFVCQVSSSDFAYLVLCTFTLSGNGSKTGFFYQNASDGTPPPQDAVATIEPVGNDWYRCSITATSYNGPNTLNSTLFEIRPTTSSSSGTLHVWGRQVEVGGFVTSYIKTTSLSAVTRNADVASMTSTDFSSWYNATEGTVFLQGDLVGVGKAVFGAAAARAWSINDSTSNERMFLNAETQPSAGAATTTGAFAVIDGGAVQASVSAENPASNAIANFTYKYATVYKANDFAASVNGSSTQTDTSGTVPTVNRLQLGADETNNKPNLCGPIAKFYSWNTLLSNGT